MSAEATHTRTLDRLAEIAAKRRKAKALEQELFDDMQDLAVQAKSEGATLRAIAHAGGISHVGVKYWLRDRTGTGNR